MEENKLSQAAKELKANQLGWIDENILSELVLITTSYPSEHRFFRIYDFWITIREGVWEKDNFVLGHKGEILKRLKSINEELISVGAGKILYCKLTQTGVIGTIKVHDPVVANSQTIETLMQPHVDDLADKYADYSVYPKKVRWEFILHK